SISTAAGGLFFFFSSRRRHTRFSRDWSSDVCSSDLGEPLGAQVGDAVDEASGPTGDFLHYLHEAIGIVAAGVAYHQHQVRVPARSEERRVGKECKSRWAPSDSAKTTRHMIRTRDTLT